MTTIIHLTDTQAVNRHKPRLAQKCESGPKRKLSRFKSTLLGESGFNYLQAAFQMENVCGSI